MSTKQSSDLSAWLRDAIADFINRSPENNLKDKDNEKAFEDCLVGYSRGNDPLYEAYKEYVGPFHWKPSEIFNLAFPDLDVTPEELTVISWILPHKEATKVDNRREKIYPAERWARARIFGEAFNTMLRKHVVEVLLKAGYESVAPLLSSEWSVKPSEKYVMASTWSERHAAHASGLGTLGLCDGLITPVGKAMRAGSVVARIRIPPTPRPYKDHREYCLFLTKGICGECIPRCPVGALSEKGHDKVKCRSFLKPNTEEYVKSHYGFDGYGCGLCQTGVPCESKIPGKQDLKEAANQ
jgi:epoxyqueuosine reductase QueG